MINSKSVMRAAWDAAIASQLNPKPAPNFPYTQVPTAWYKGTSLWRRCS